MWILPDRSRCPLRQQRHVRLIRQEPDGSVPQSRKNSRNRIIRDRILPGLSAGDLQGAGQIFFPDFRGSICHAGEEPVQPMQRQASL